MTTDSGNPKPRLKIEPHASQIQRVDHDGEDGGAIPVEGQEFRSPSATQLAEWSLVKHDLEMAVGNLELLKGGYSLIETSPEVRAASEALYRDAIVQFVGCFGTKPNKLSAREVFSSPEQQENFGYLQNLRDSFAAHNFGPHRQCMVVLTPTGTPGQLSFTELRLMLCFPEERLLDAYGRMFNVAISAVDQKIEPLRVAVLRELNAMTPAEIQALPAAEFRVPRSTEARMSRKAFRNGTRSGRN